MNLILIFNFRYKISQRVDARQSPPLPTGLPPYCLMLRRVADPGLSSDAPTSTGVRVLAADLPHAHRGSQAPVPFDAIGELVPQAAEVPHCDASMFAPGGTHHRFNLQWNYQTEGN